MLEKDFFQLQPYLYFSEAYDLKFYYITTIFWKFSSIMLFEEMHFSNGFKFLIWHPTSTLFLSIGHPSGTYIDLTKSQNEVSNLFCFAVFLFTLWCENDETFFCLKFLSTVWQSIAYRISQ